MWRARVIIGTLLALVCVVETQAENQVSWEPPKFNLPGNGARATVKNEIAASLHVAGMSIKLEETEMEAARQRLGGVLGVSGDAAGHLEWLCYKGSDTAGSWALWLESDEMDAGRVAGFQWRRVSSDTPFDKRCQALTGEMTIDQHPDLRLGLSQDQTQRILGPPSAAYRDIREFQHEHRESIHKMTYYSEDSVYLEIQNSKIQAIQAWKVTED